MCCACPSTGYQCVHPDRVWTDGDSLVHWRFIHADIQGITGCRCISQGPCAMAWLASLSIHPCGIPRTLSLYPRYILYLMKTEQLIGSPGWVFGTADTSAIPPTLPFATNPITVTYRHHDSSIDRWLIQWLSLHRHGEIKHLKCSSTGTQIKHAYVSLD